MVKKHPFLFPLIHLIILGIVTSGFLLPSLVYAQPGPVPATDDLITNPALSESLRNLSGSDFTSLLISNIITILIVIACVAAVIFFLINAIKVITSGGNKDQHAKGREGMIMAMFGLLVLFLLYMILNLIGYIFDMNLLSIDISSLFLR